MNNIFLKNIINQRLCKYNIDINKFYVLIINYLIYNKPLHFVSLFKDYLIYDDNNEFLNEFYNKNISNIFLLELINNNNKNNKIFFPNFI